MKTKILGIYLKNRTDEATEVQKILTENGCLIKTRLGIHETGSICSPSGLIILELIGDEEDWNKLENKLIKIDGITVKSMQFG